jgi:glycosyltransferase involved in cell wall biosynthesis
MYSKFSVVIPTLGGEALFRTIDFINSGSIVPNEILICIPEDFSYRVEKLTRFHNIKIVRTKCKGQVLQRIEGFKQVINDYVVQMDDDMYVYETCLERLLEGLNKFEEKVSIAPAMVFDTTEQSCYQFEYRDSKIRSFIEGENWFQPGNITRSGLNLGLNALLSSERFSAVDWLPGGCVAHKKQNLILYNYFPFKGKAFFEDVIQSIHLTKNKVRLLIDNNALCGIDEYEVSPPSLLSNAKNFNKYYRYRKHIVRLRRSSIFYLLLDGFYNYLMTVKTLLNLLLKTSKVSESKPV